MVHCRMYHAAARTANQQSQWVTALQNEAATQSAAGRLLVPATVGSFDGAYKWGAVWRFAVVAEFRFIDAEGAEADAQWTRAINLMQGNNVVDSFAERWDQAADDPTADQSRLNYQRLDL